MPMQAESLEVLEKASVAPAQARAFVRAIEIEIAGAKDTLATKHDLIQLEARLQLQIAETRAALHTEIAKHGAELRTEIARSVGSVTRQMYTAILGQMAVLLGFAYFFATHLR
jgi:hypothetical protein